MVCTRCGAWGAHQELDPGWGYQTPQARVMAGDVLSPQNMAGLGHRRGVNAAVNPKAGLLPGSGSDKGWHQPLWDTPAAKLPGGHSGGDPRCGGVPSAQGGMAVCGGDTQCWGSCPSGQGAGVGPGGWRGF
uniref:Uncharacterized protein n=1 Tax=Falco tinnunculus TaxID=100819 RepID=A0A8C4UI58_FALTI